MARFGKSAPCDRLWVTQKCLWDLLLFAETLPFLVLLFANQWKSVVLGSPPRNNPCSDRRSLKGSHHPPKQWRWLWHHSLGCSTRLQEVQRGGAYVINTDLGAERLGHPSCWLEPMQCTLQTWWGRDQVWVFMPCFDDRSETVPSV